MLDKPVNESTVRQLKKSYLGEQLRRAAADLGRLDQLPSKKRGSPLLVGNNMDSLIQDYI